MNQHTREQPPDLARTDWIDELEAHIQRRLGGLVRDFRLLVQGGGLVLRGHTHTYYAKQLAQEAVRGASTLPTRLSR
jgi:hypothetical protein